MADKYYDKKMDDVMFFAFLSKPSGSLLDFAVCTMYIEPTIKNVCINHVLISL